MPKIAFLSNAPKGSVFRLGSHHLSAELAKLGHDVFHISTGVSQVELFLGREIRSRSRPFGDTKLSRAHRAVVQGAFRDDTGVTHISPRTLLPVRWVRNPPSVNRVLDELGLGSSDFVVLDQLLFTGPALTTPASLVYRPADIQTSPLGKALEQRVIARADAFVACSSFVATTLESSVSNHPQMILENGVDTAFFASEFADREPAFIYVGALDHRFDWGFVSELASKFRSIPIRLAGPHNGTPPPMPPNVELLGPVAYDDVPELLQSSTIGLLPLNDDPMNAGRSPMKYYEYLAAGLRVIARSTPELASREHIDGVHLYKSAPEGLRAAHHMVSDRSVNTLGIAEAKEYSWPLRALLLDAFLTTVRPIV